MTSIGAGRPVHSSKAERALRDEHLEPVHGGHALLARSGEQRRGAFLVDQIDDIRVPTDQIVR